MSRVGHGNLLCIKGGFHRVFPITVDSLLCLEACTDPLHFGECLVVFRASVVSNPEVWVSE